MKRQLSYESSFWMLLFWTQQEIVSIHHFLNLKISFLECWLCSSFIEETTNYNNLYLCVYCSLAKDHPWAEQLVLFQVLNRKGVSMSFLQWLGALEANNETMIHNRTTSGFKVKSWQHTTLWTVPCNQEYVQVAVCATLATSVCAKLPCITISSEELSYLRYA